MQALEVYQQIQCHGWPMVEALRTFRLTEQEAEALFMRIQWLTEHLPEMVAQWRGPTPDTRAPTHAAAQQNGWG